MFSQHLDAASLSRQIAHIRSLRSKTASSFKTKTGTPNRRTVTRPDHDDVDTISQLSDPTLMTLTIELNDDNSIAKSQKSSNAISQANIGGEYEKVDTQFEAVSQHSKGTDAMLSPIEKSENRNQKETPKLIKQSNREINNSNNNTHVSNENAVSSQNIIHTKSSQKEPWKYSNQKSPKIIFHNANNSNSPIVNVADEYNEWKKRDVRERLQKHRIRNQSPDDGLDFNLSSDHNDISKHLNVEVNSQISSIHVDRDSIPNDQNGDKLKTTSSPNEKYKIISKTGKNVCLNEIDTNLRNKQRTDQRMRHRRAGDTVTVNYNDHDHMYDTNTKITSIHEHRAQNDFESGEYLTRSKNSINKNSNNIHDVVVAANSNQSPINGSSNPFDALSSSSSPSSPNSSVSSSTSSLMLSMTPRSIHENASGSNWNKPVDVGEEDCRNQMKSYCDPLLSDSHSYFPVSSNSENEVNVAEMIGVPRQNRLENLLNFDLSKDEIVRSALQMCCDLCQEKSKLMSLLQVVQPDCNWDHETVLKQRLLDFIAEILKAAKLNERRSEHSNSVNFDPHNSVIHCVNTVFEEFSFRNELDDKIHEIVVLRAQLAKEIQLRESVENQLLNYRQVSSAVKKDIQIEKRAHFDAGNDDNDIDRKDSRTPSENDKVVINNDNLVPYTNVSNATSSNVSLSSSTHSTFENRQSNAVIDHVVSDSVLSNTHNDDNRTHFGSSSFPVKSSHDDPNKGRAERYQRDHSHSRSEIKTDTNEIDENNYDYEDNNNDCVNDDAVLSLVSLSSEEDKSLDDVGGDNDDKTGPDGANEIDRLAPNMASYLEVSLGGGHIETIRVTLDSSPEILCEEFLSRHYLPWEYYDPLLHYIRHTQEQLLVQLVDSIADKSSTRGSKSIETDMNESNTVRETPANDFNSYHDRNSSSMITSTIHSDKQNNQETEASESDEQKVLGSNRIVTSINEESSCVKTAVDDNKKSFVGINTKNIAQHINSTIVDAADSVAISKDCDMSHDTLPPPPPPPPPLPLTSSSPQLTENTTTVPTSGVSIAQSRKRVVPPPPLPPPSHESTVEKEVVFALKSNNMTATTKYRGFDNPLPNSINQDSKHSSPPQPLTTQASTQLRSNERYPTSPLNQGVVDSPLTRVTISPILSSESNLINSTNGSDDRDIHQASHGQRYLYSNVKYDRAELDNEIYSQDEDCEDSQHPENFIDNNPNLDESSIMEVTDQIAFQRAIEMFDKASNLANVGNVTEAAPLYEYSLVLFEKCELSECKLSVIRSEVAYWVGEAMKARKLQGRVLKPGKSQRGHGTSSIEHTSSNGVSPRGNSRIRGTSNNNSKVHY